MSVVNVSFLSESEILMQSDTLSYRDGKPAGLHKSKVYAGNSFACGQRGLVTVANGFDAVMSKCVDMDHAIAVCLELLRNNASSIVEGAARFFPTAPASHQMLFGGWSPSRNLMIVVKVILDAGGVQVTVTDTPGQTYLNPDLRAGLTVQAATRDQLVKLALHQSKLLQFAPGMCIGGVIHVTSVRRDSVKQCVAGLYPNYWELSQVFGDPNSDAVRDYLKSREMAA